MRLALVTLAIGEYHQSIAQLTHPLMREYCAKVGAEFVSLTDSRNHRLPHYRKLELGELFKKYDRLLYADTDVLIRPDAPNLFEMVPETHLGICEEGKWDSRDSMMKKFSDAISENLQGWDGRYYNSGLWVASRCHDSLFRVPKGKETISSFYEQTYFNFQIVRSCPQIFELPLNCNHTLVCDRALGKSRRESFLIHYAGIRCWNGQGCLLQLIMEDISFFNLEMYLDEDRYQPDIPKNRRRPGHPWYGELKNSQPNCKHIPPSYPVFESLTCDLIDSRIDS